MTLPIPTQAVTRKDINKAQFSKPAKLWTLAPSIIVILWAIVAPSSAIAEDGPVGRFKAYLRIDTVHPNPNYKPAAEFLHSQAQAIGLDYESLEFVRDKPVVLLTWKGRDPLLPSILLNSHTDVVPAELDKWVHEPFSAAQDVDGNIFARGSQDMKCLGMQYLEAIRNLKEKGFHPLRTVHLSFVPDEEVGGVDGACKFVSSLEFSKLNIGVSLDEGLASPSENYRVFNGERAPWWLEIKSVGAPGHGAKMYDNTAFENLLKSLERISKFRESQFNLVKAGLEAEGEVISINNVYLKSGSPTLTGFVMNLQPSEAEAGFDIRLPPLADCKELERHISEEWAPASRNLTYKFVQKADPRDRHGHPSVTLADDSNPWWVLLKDAVSKAGGKLGNPEIFAAATDARYIRNEGIPAFGFSPMANTPVLLHAHNEFLNVGEYVKGITIYEEIIRAFASYEKPRDHSTTDPHTEL